MPRIAINGCDYHYVDEGPDGRAEPVGTVFFGPGYLMTHRLFRRQVAVLRDDYRCISIDWRGQGLSEVTSGGYDVPSLARDAAALIEAVDAAPCVYVGLSMGGFVGLHLGFDASELLRGLVLMDTSARVEPWSARLRYNVMLVTTRLFGYDPVIGRVLPILFGPDFLTDPERSSERELWTEILTSSDRVGVYRAGRGIFTRENVEHRLDEIDVPTLVVVGEDDIAQPWRESEILRDGITDAELVTIPGAGHSPPIERPDRVTEMLLEFLERVGSPERG